MINKYCYDSNIPFHIIVPSIKAQDKSIPDILTTAEIQLIIDSAPKPYNLAIRCIFNMGAGLRVSEIIKMNWSHIRWVDWLANKENYGIAIIKAGKGSKDRVVNIPTKLMQDLYSYAKEENVLNEFGIPQGSSIFHFDEGRTERKKKEDNELMRFDLEQFKDYYLQSRYDWFRYHIVKKHCEKALGKRIKIHSLRHSRATYLYSIEKVPVEKIQVLLGHSSINTTMLYTKINPISIFELLKNTKVI
jgi:integrase